MSFKRPRENEVGPFANRAQQRKPAAQDSNALSSDRILNHCTGNGAQQRKQNGAFKPWKVKFWNHEYSITS